MASENDVWQMFFYGASRIGLTGKIITGVGDGIRLARDHVLPRAFSLTEPCSNNIAEYNALLNCLQLAQQIVVQYLEACGDSK